MLTLHPEVQGSDNPWVYQGNIPLGVIKLNDRKSRKARGVYDSEMARQWFRTDEESSKKSVFMKLPMINGEAISDTFFIVGRTNSGKSVTFRLIYWFTSKVRPVIVFDYTGRDHYWSFLENSRPKNLPPDTLPSGIKNAVYAYYPVKGARPKTFWEREVRPNFSKYSPEQLSRLGFAEAGSDYLKNIMVRYGPFKDFSDLVDFVKGFPSNENEYKRASKRFCHHHKFYEEGDYLPQMSKTPILRTLNSLLYKGFYAMNNSQEIRLENIISKGKSVFYSLNDQDAAKAELDYLLNELQRLRDTKPWLPRPYIFIEEAHDIVSEDVAHFIKVCRKLSIGVGLCMPVVPKEFPEDALSDIKNILVAKLKGDSFRKVLGLIGDRRAEGIPYLLSNAYTGEREMMFHNGHWDHTYGPIEMYECPQEMHRETGQDASVVDEERR